MGIEIKLLLIEGIVIIGLNILFAFLALAHIEKKPHTVLPDPFYYVILNSLIFPMMIPILNYYYLQNLSLWVIITGCSLGTAFISQEVFFKIIDLENPKKWTPKAKSGLGIFLKKFFTQIFIIISLFSSFVVVLFFLV